MPAQFTLPPDNRAVGTGNPPADMNGVVDALTAMGATFNICNAAFAGGADPTGAADSTAAFNAALAALPTKTIYANPVNSTGATAVVPVGTILLGAGTFKFGSLGTDTNNIGPCVNLIGAGRNATTIAYYGAGDCLRLFNPVLPASNTLDTIAAWHGIINGFIIDGINAQAGATGLHYGDTDSGTLGPDLMIRNFSQGRLTTVPVLTLGTTSGSGGTFAAGTYFWCVTAQNRNGETIASNQVTATLALNGTQGLTWTSVSGATGYRVYRGPGASGTPNTYVATLGAVTAYTDTGTSLYVSCPPAVNTTGNIGLHLDNTVSWTEGMQVRMLIVNCGQAVVFSGCNPSPDASFEYNDMSFHVHQQGQNQNGIVLRNGAYYNQGSLSMRANFVDGPTAMQSASLALCGAFSGTYSQITTSRLEITCENNTPLSGGGSFSPMTISFSDPNHNPIQGCTGILSWLPFGAAWTSSNYGSATLKTTFNFAGIVKGDTALSPASSNLPTAIGATLQATGFAVSTFQPLSSGDSFALTLAGNTTMVLAAASTPCIAGPQRKTFVITQSAGGGNTVAWPSPGSPTLSNPAVIWPGGTAPVQSTAANAVDVYTLTTTDGIHWYGSASLASSPGTTLLATTGASGFALQNATPTIITWTAPNDGLLHRVTLYGLLHVATNETGGVVSFQYTGPFGGAAAHTSQIFAGSLASDTTGVAPSFFNVVVGPGTTVSILQTSALTAGAATVYAELWGS